MSTYLSIYLSIYLYIYLSIYLSIYLFIYLPDQNIVIIVRYVFANGDVYDGDFQRGQACGQGVYRYAVSGGGAGDCYVGGWEADRRHGKGVLRWGNGSRYEARRGEAKRACHRVRH